MSSERRSRGHEPRRGQASSGVIPGLTASVRPATADHLAVLVTAPDEVIFVLDSDRTIRAVSTSNESLLPRPRSELLGKGIGETVPADACQRLESIFERVLETSRSEDSEYPVQLADGTHWFRAHIMPVVQTGGDPRRLCLLARDITEKKKSEEALEKSKGMLAQAAQLANLASWEADLRSGQLTWSDQLYQTLGLNPQEVVATDALFWRLVHPDDREWVRADAADALTKGRPLDQEVRYVLLDGSVRVLHTRAIPILDESGMPVRLVGMSQDITLRRQIEDSLRKNQSLLAQAEHIALLGSWEWDAAASELRWSDQMFSMMGLDPEKDEANLSLIFQMVHPSDRERLKVRFSEALHEGRPYDHVVRYLLPNGRVSMIRTACRPVTDASGRVVRLFGTSQDVTEQKQTESRLHELSGRLLTLRDEERRRVALHLHETVIQSLAALKMTLAHLEAEINDKKSIAYDLQRSASAIAEDAIREARTVCYLMHPPMLDMMGLASALSWLAEGFGKRSGIAVKLAIDGGLGRLSQEIETTIFHIVQEALTNIHRHSGSRTATIGIACAMNTVRIEIEDHGCGIPATVHTPIGRQAPLGVGIAGMRERVAQLKGSFNISSAPQKGTSIHISIPLD